MICKIGFMQGRLCDPVNGLIQAFPSKDWQKEFGISQEIGINLMEWTLDSVDISKNPLLSKAGRQKILGLQKKHCLEIDSLTGDCFMQTPFWKSKGKDQDFLHNQFISICQASSQLGIKVIVLPLVDNGSLENSQHEDQVIGFLQEQSSFLKLMNLHIAFESDFEPIKLASFISRFSSNQFGINYDMGNSASMGFDPKEEFAAYGELIFNIHIKDRLLNGSTVALKEGNTNFDCVFEQIKKINYSANLILQTARAKDNDHAALIKTYFNFTKALIAKHNTLNQI